MQLIPREDTFQTYGRWNTLVAKSSGGSILGSVWAHDGDFFPESVFDYIESLRGARPNGDFPATITPIRVDIDITHLQRSLYILSYRERADW